MRKIISLITVLALAASCTPKHTAEVAVVEKDLGVCLGVDLTQPTVLGGEVMSLGMAILALIAAGPEGWPAKIAALAVKYGPKAITCGAQIAKDLFATTPTPVGVDAGVGPSTAAHEESPADRANQVIQSLK